VDDSFRETLTRQFGLDKPLWWQYLRYCGEALTAGDQFYRNKGQRCRTPQHGENGQQALACCQQLSVGSAILWQF
jgi:hypothetical protein